MPQADLAAILASLPPLTFAPATEAPVSGQWCLVAPADAEWCIAQRLEEGWFHADGTRIDEPLVYAPLPPAPGRISPRMIKNLASYISEAIEDGDYTRAASAIDELADAVRAVRDSRPAHLTE